MDIGRRRLCDYNGGGVNLGTFLPDHRAQPPFPSHQNYPLPPPLCSNRKFEKCLFRFLLLNETAHRSYRVTHKNGTKYYKPPVDSVMGIYGSWWAATAGTYRPGMKAEHPKSKSMGGVYRSDGSPCRNIVAQKQAGADPPNEVATRDDSST